MDEKVLEALEPHQNVKRLVIREFQGSNFPLWMGSYSTLVNLTSLFITGCSNCPSLPQVIGELPWLKSLDLGDLTVEYIIENESGDPNVMKPIFPSLKNLSLHRLPRLKGLLKVDEGIIFSTLENLCVHDCCSVTLPQLSSLKHISCNSMSLASFIKLENLTSLIISFNEGANSLLKETLENLVCLEFLRILEANEHSLPAEGLHGLTSLTKLTITSCNRLMCLPVKWFTQLTALRHLNVDNCKELVEFPDEIKNLQNLTTLGLHGLNKMLFLPDALQHLTSLQSLQLTYLLELTALPNWLGNFTSLTSLVIQHCRKVASFPASMNQLVNLINLYVIDCPVLWKRCEKSKGEDWLKIRHIPYLQGRM